jgi:hypothetical protein
LDAAQAAGVELHLPAAPAARGAGANNLGGMSAAGGYGAAAPAAPQDRARAMFGARRQAGRSAQTAPRRGQPGDKADLFAEDLARREKLVELYRQLDKTKEWAENNYYQLPITEQDAGLIAVNAFWNDYARHPRQQPFLSRHWPEAAGNFSEMMFALALLDLPLRRGEPETERDGVQVTLLPGGPRMIFHQQIREADARDQASAPILISQNFFRHGDRYRQVQGQQQDKFITDEFLVHTLYGCQVVVTNPSSTPRRVNVLVQIPRGSLPAKGSQRTDTVPLDVAPFQTQTVEYYFYFPLPGDHPHFPAHVAADASLLAAADPFMFHVRQRPSSLDRESWDYLSQHGSPEQVLDYLRAHNVQELDLTRVAFRLRDRDFFQALTKLLTERHLFEPTLWSYAFLHDIPQTIGEYLRHADAFVAQCGSYLQSELLDIDPVVRQSYQHLEYRPLVNPRAHPLGRGREILNDRFYEQYHALMDVLCHRSALSDDDLMSVTYYLLLQDRIGEALEHFARVRPANLQTRLQYDYFAAYLDCYQASPQLAPVLAAKYADYPVERWSQAFAAIGSMLAELQGQPATVTDRRDRDQTQTQAASREPSFDFSLAGKRVQLRYQNLDQLQVNYYLIDLELLFSRNPFVQEFSSSFSHVRPHLSQAVPLPPEATQQEIELPASLQNRNVLVEVVAAGTARGKAYYSNSLSVQLAENYGQLTVTDAASGQPLPRTYIKVYAQLNDGSTVFYKDGYTDLRGRFDYTSLSTDQLDRVQRFAVLVIAEEHGGLIREARPPQR